VATAAPLKAIAATFTIERAPGDGGPIPPGWHIGYFRSTATTASLAPDGTPAGTGVLPKLPLPRRMYAGARPCFHASMCVGDRLRRETELTGLDVREGGTGMLAAQTRRIFTPRGLAVTEDYDTVFREEVTRAAAPTRGGPTGPAEATDDRCGPIVLFRFSALTGNPHRIHYDRPHAMAVEGCRTRAAHPNLPDRFRARQQSRAPGPQRRHAHVRRRRRVADPVGGTTTEGGCEACAISSMGGIAMQARASLG